MRSRTLALVVLLAAGACRGGERPAPARDAGPGAAAVVAQVAAIASALYGDARVAAEALAAAVDALVARPSQPALDAARRAWIAARVPYMQTETFRYSDGPIDRVEGLINSWPIDESWVEALVAARTPITPEVLVARNEKEGEKNISTGFHAVEYLLWGPDRSDDGPGDRPVADLVEPARDGPRRAEYLRVATRLLVRHLGEVAAQWAPAGEYRRRFLALPPDAALALVIKGMGMLSGPELMGERLTVAYETKDQENEHSCFSDNTCADLAGDALGVRNLYVGRYEGRATVSGPGVRDLLRPADPALADRLGRQIDASVAALRAIPPPFDRALLGTDDAPGRVAIKRAIDALAAQTESLAEAARALRVDLRLDDVGRRRAGGGPR